jgi:hypothetical protein
METPNKLDCMAYIEQEIKDLDSDTMIKFGTMVYNTFPELVKSCPDGIRIHLNNISEEWLLKLYVFVRDSVEESEKLCQPLDFVKKT